MPMGYDWSLEISKVKVFGDKTCLGCVVCSIVLEQDFNIKATLG